MATHATSLTRASFVVEHPLRMQVALHSRQVDAIAQIQEEVRVWDFLPESLLS